MRTPPTQLSAVTIFGVHILGLDSHSLWKIALTLIVIAAIVAVRALLRVVSGFHTHRSKRLIWARKYVRLGIGALGVLIILSIWFDNPARLATFTGLIAAGAAIASQNAILSVAGYFMIVFGKAFDLGDRIQIGEVR